MLKTMPKPQVMTLGVLGRLRIMFAKKTFGCENLQISTSIITTLSIVTIEGTKIVRSRRDINPDLLRLPGLSI